MVQNDRFEFSLGHACTVRAYFVSDQRERSECGRVSYRVAALPL